MSKLGISHHHTATISRPSHKPDQTIKNKKHLCSKMKFVNFLPVADDVCYFVQHLEFYRNSDHHITDDDLADVIPDCPNLKTIIFTGIPDLSDRTLVSLASSAHDLRYIDISGCKHVTNVGIMEIANQASRLEVIRLNDITIPIDPSVSALVRSLAHLKELELCNLPFLTASSVRDIWTYARQLRKLRLSRCPHLTDKAFPSPVTPVTTPTRSSGRHNRWRIPPNSVRYCEKESIIPRTTETDGIDLPQVHPRPLTWLDELSPLVLSPFQNFKYLRVLDLGHCWKITDDAIAGIVKHAPRIQSLHISGCRQLTDASLDDISMLGVHLDVLSMANLDKITDRGIVQLARGCTKLRSIDIACKTFLSPKITTDEATLPSPTDCTRLTDLSVLELASLPNLHRVSVVHIRALTDNVLLFLAEHTPTLSRLSISHCPRFSLEAIQILVKKLIGLELLSASGLLALRRRGVKRFSDRTPVVCTFTTSSTKLSLRPTNRDITNHCKDLIVCFEEIK